MFLDGRLVALTGSIAHMADMGGALWSADTAELFEEGLLLPPLLWLRAGVRNADIEAIIRGNSRLPDQVIGDMPPRSRPATRRRAGCASSSGATGIADLLPLSREICARTERAMRAAIAALPDGTYHSSSTSTAPARSHAHRVAPSRYAATSCTSTTPAPRPRSAARMNT